jgi:pimeloyl-ACP methyl ester carboxylesterase
MSMAAFSLEGPVPSASIDRSLNEDPLFDAAYPPAVIELQIPSSAEQLPGHIYLAAGKGPHPTVVLLHGFPGNEKNLDIAQALRRHGFNTLFFHYRGAWGGTGTYRVAQLPDDALAVLAFLRDDTQADRLRVDREALSLLGHSLGGYTALAAGARDRELACVMSLSPANPGLWKAGLQQPDDGTVERLSAYADSLFMLRGLSGERLFAELAATPDERLDTTLFGPGLTGKNVLMVVGEQDDVTPATTMFDPVVAAYGTQPGPNLTASVISGDHSFSWSRIALTRLVLGWAGEHCR